MKKQNLAIVAVLAAAMMVFALTGCSSGQEVDETTHQLGIFLAILVVLISVGITQLLNNYFDRKKKRNQKKNAQKAKMKKYKNKRK